jgi:hypothetical protein
MFGLGSGYEKGFNAEKTLEFQWILNFLGCLTLNLGF